MAPAGVCTAARGLVYALLPTRTDAGAGAEQRVVQFAESVAATVERSTGLTLHVGIGTSKVATVADVRSRVLCWN
ncbi:hypothetical protein OG349_34365 [Streptomyces sp. NBC_01317]|uniref:hypothetical protein n=1 Tax=Streptomyces sp. NBC_01317 TaxID=2903822 RepID=UPI002E13CE32|nr:hypothetical protein OG349_34365 [Streptomyces sp. NBC_01317]